MDRDQDQDDIFCVSDQEDEDNEHGWHESRAIMHSIAQAGYREGLAKNEEIVRQKAFDEGLQQGIEAGELAGIVYGLACKAQADQPSLFTTQQTIRLSELLLQYLSVYAENAQNDTQEELDRLMDMFPVEVKEAYSLLRSRFNNESS
jgi:hypothetical protein